MMMGLPELPTQLVLQILQLLPPIAQAYSGKLVNKAAYSGLEASSMYAASAGVPTWVLRQYLPAEPTVEAQTVLLSKLLNHRAAAGDLQGVMFLRSQGASWDCSTTAAAAGAGQLGVLLYLRAQNPPCDWDICTCTAAAAGGHLDILQWCRSQHPPAPWADSTATAAASAGHLEVLQWLLKPYPALADITNLNPNSLLSCHSSDDIQITEPPPQHQGFSKAVGLQQQTGASGGTTTGMTGANARHQPCPCAPWLLCAAAAKAGQLRVLRWLRANGASWDAGVCAAAAAGGHLPVLEWLLNQSPPCPINSEALFEAASAGQLHTLKYIRLHVPHVAWEESTTLAAAMSGQLQVMKWLRQQVPPCPWVAGTSAAAAASGNQELLLWLKAQGAP